ncbi:MAG: hypothetical protein HYX68_20745 [Planctomycetes bacterium]|nr:hypothetical protein [Planctomycetota bacterium]
MSDASGAATCPYPGLRPFRQDESAIFFGRGEQVADMLPKLEEHRFLAVVGASGCGKSSMVRAGLLPALAQGFLATAEEGDPWYMIVARPGDAPLRNLAQELVRVLRPETPKAEEALQIALVYAALRRGPRSLSQLVHDSHLPGNAHVLVLIDQFEELFRFQQPVAEAAPSPAAPDENTGEGDGPDFAAGALAVVGRRANARPQPAAPRAEAAEFVALLLATAAQSKRPIYVVITMRSDFMGDCDAFHGLPEAISNSQYLTPRLTRDQAHDAIVEPARLVQGQIEPGLVNRILNEIGNNPDELPLMQHCLMRLWHRARPEEKPAGNGKGAARLLRLADYESLGGLERALHQHGEEIYQSLTPRQCEITRVLFQSLSERDTRQARSGGRDIRRPATLGTVADVAGVPWEEVRTVVEIFRQPGVNFLALSPKQELTRNTLLDISHESLLRRWTRMRHWVEAEAKSAEIYQRLCERAWSWAAAERDEDEVLPRLQLANTLDWKEKNNPTRAWAQRYGGRANDPEGQTFDLAMEYLEASKQRSRIEEDRKKQKLKLKYLGWGLGTAVILLVFASISLVMAIRSRQEARRSAKEARDNLVKAKKSQGEADVNAKIARAKVEQAQDVIRKANVLRLVEASGEALRTGKYINGVLFATEAAKMAQGQMAEANPEWAELKAIAERTLREALASLGGRGFHADVGDVSTLAIQDHQKNGKFELRWLAAAGANGKIALWDFADRPAPSIGWLAQLAFPKYRELSFGFGPLVHQLVLTRNDRLIVFSSDPVPAGFSAGLSLSRRHHVTIFELTDLDRTPRVFAGLANFHASPEGRWLALDDGASKFKFLHLGTDVAQVAEYDLDLPPSRAGLRFASFAPENAWFARIDAKGEAFLFDLRDPTRPPVTTRLDSDPKKSKATAAYAPARSVAFSKTGNRLVVFLDPGVARVWSQTKGGWTPVAAEIDLAEGLKIPSPRELLVTPDGSAAMLIPRALAPRYPFGGKPGDPLAAGGPGYFFDIHDTRWPRAISLPDCRDVLGYQPIHFSRGNQIVMAQDRFGNRISWDMRNPSALPRRIPNAPGNLTLLPFGRRFLTTDASLVRLWQMGGGANDLGAAASNAAGSNVPAPLTLLGVPPLMKAIALSREGRWFATGGQNGMIRVWNMNPLSISTEPFVYWNPSPARHLLFTPDKRQLVALLPDEGLRIRSLDSLAVHRFAGQGAHLMNSSEGNWLLGVRPGSGSCELWDLQKDAPKRIATLDVGKGMVVGVHVDKANQWLALQVEQGQNGAGATLFWRITKLRQIPEVDQPKPSAPDAKGSGVPLAFLPAENQLLAQDKNGRLAVWTLGEEELATRLLATPIEGDALVTPDGSRLIANKAAPENAAANHLDVFPIAKLLADTKKVVPVRCQAKTPWNRFFVSSNGKVVCVVNKKDETEFVRYFLLGGPNTLIQPFSFIRNPSEVADAEKIELKQQSLDQRWVLTRRNQTGNREWRLWDLNEPTEVGNYLTPAWTRNLDSASFTTDSRWLVAAGDGKVQAIELSQARDADKAGTSYNFPAKVIRLTAMSPDKRWLAVVDSDHTTWIWDRNQNADQKPIHLPRFPISFVPGEMTWGADGKSIYTLGTYTGTRGAAEGANPDRLHRYDVLCLARVQFDDLASKARDAVGANLTRHDWDAVGLLDPVSLVKPMPYQKTFDPLPIPQAAAKAGFMTLKALQGIGQPGWLDIQKNVAGVLSEKSARYGVKPMDAFKVHLEAGKIYLFEMNSVKPRDPDCYLVLLGPDSKEIKTYDDDSGGDLNARIYYPCTASGTYTLIATTYTQSAKGAYRLKVSVRKKLPEAATLELVGATGFGGRKGRISKESQATGLGPGLVYRVNLGGGKRCQIDLTSADFACALHLEDDDGKLLAATSAQVNGVARLIFTNEKQTAYRVLVIATSGALPGDFTLTVQAR